MLHESSLMRVLVTGIGGPAGKAVASFLTKKSCHTIGVDMNPDVKSLDITSFYSVPAGNSTGFIERLLNITIEERIQQIIPTVDEELIPIAEHKSLFENCGKILVISPLEAIKICRDKYKTALFLRERNVPCPHTILAEDGIHFHLPVLVKPRLGRGGRGIAIFEDRLKLEAARSLYDSSFVFQEFVSGAEYDANLFIHNGKILVNQVLLKKKLEHGNFGNALETVKINDSEIEDLAAKTAMALKLEGPADIDIRKDEQGTPKILEVNPRVGANVLKARAVLAEMLHLVRRR